MARPLAAQPVLRGSLAGTNFVLAWPASPSLTGSTNPFPEFSILQSTDLANWSPLQGKAIGIPGLSGSALNVSLKNASGARFYRLAMDESSTNTQEVGTGGADVFGYNNLLAAQMRQNGAFSVSNFAAMHPQPAYLAQIDFDPTTAQYWTNFNTNPALWESNLPPSKAGQVWNDFRLTTNELAAFKTNGFVVSERLGSVSFAQSYYRIYSDDLPVFISADSILHAWHRTYDGMLEELEELELSTLMEQVITGMTTRLPVLAQEYQTCLATHTGHTNSAGPLTQSLADMDFFLTTAQSLWLGAQQPSALGLPSVNQQVTAALADVASLQLQYFAPFGALRPIDFSQFTIRGHYVNSVRLGRYFQTMMWCGMIDFLIAPLDARHTLLADGEDHLRQLGAGIVMSSLINQLAPSNGPPNPWPALDQVGRIFAGVTDSMTPPQLASLLATDGIASPCNVLDPVVLTNLETRLLTGELALSTDWQPPLFAPNGPSLVKQASSLTLFGQRFVLDGWAMTEVTWDRTAVERRKASVLDVAFSVLGNDQTVPLLAARMNSTNGLAWRDGIQYQTNLAAVRGVIDGQAPSVWTNNIYTAWLGALRALSAPTTDPKYPEAMRTRAWAMKTLTTQAASWTELKHDTILYAQPAYTPGDSCYYPNGFVEPAPEFWAQMAALANLAAKAVSHLPLYGEISLPPRDNPNVPPWDYVNYSLANVQAAEVESLNNFSTQMAILQSMAAKELAQQPFETNEIIFLESTMEGVYETYFGVPTYTGWYPGLFYENVYQEPGEFNQNEGCDRWDALVADVDTDLLDEVTGDPGADIHDAVGNVNMLMIAVDNGTNRMVYAGPVLSHYEFQEPLGTRLTDDQWKAILQGPPVPPPDDWTSGYLIPGGFVYPWQKE